MASSLSSTLSERVTSCHFEVVDEQDRTVGGIKHATRYQAHDLRDALIHTSGIGRLAVVEVTEHTAVRREVVRY